MDSLPKDYLQKEYELRLAYLKDHFSRMWTRFNFFLTINTGLFAATLSLKESSKQLVLPVCILGIVMSVCWNQFAATDNYLVDVYRRQVTHAHFLLIQDASFEALRVAPLPNELFTWKHTGATAAKYFDTNDRQVKEFRQGFFQRRIPWLSATELGVAISVLYALAWLALLIVTR